MTTITLHESKNSLSVSCPSRDEPPQVTVRMSFPLRRQVTRRFPLGQGLARAASRLDAFVPLTSRRFGCSGKSAYVRRCLSVDSCAFNR